MSDLPNALTLFVDPGEDTGWCLARGRRLLVASTTKMWTFADDVVDALNGTYMDGGILDPDSVAVREGVERDNFELPIERIVCEDWRLYPDKLRALAWDQCRTARLIGALTLLTRMHNIEWVLQPAAIKAQAVAAGAEEFFYRPLHENRHQNDAIMHFVWYTTNNASDDLLRKGLHQAFPNTRPV